MSTTSVWSEYQNETRGKFKTGFDGQSFPRRHELTDAVSTVRLANYGGEVSLRVFLNYGDDADPESIDERLAEVADSVAVEEVVEKREDGPSGATRTYVFIGEGDGE